MYKNSCATVFRVLHVQPRQERSPAQTLDEATRGLCWVVGIFCFSAPVFRTNGTDRRLKLNTTIKIGTKEHTWTVSPTKNRTVLFPFPGPNLRPQLLESWMFAPVKDSTMLLGKYLPISLKSCGHELPPLLSLTSTCCIV